VRVLVVIVAFVGLALSISPASPDAAAGPLTVAPITWDVLGLDSNNVNTGPNVFPVGVRVCNTGSDPATNVVATWAWKTSQNSFTGPADGTTVNVGALAAGSCQHAYFEVTINRSASSRRKARDYQITTTADGGLTAAGTQRTLYIQPLVSQNRNSTKKLSGPGGCNLAYTVCDPAPVNIVVGRTYTYKFYAQTSTAYQQIETFVNFPTSLVQVVSTSVTYSNPAGASSSSIYGDACGWNAVTRACAGPVNIPGGKAGGRIVVTFVVKAIAPGAGTLKAAIYDSSGASYHYNADFDTATLLPGPLTVRYELATALTGNGKVTSAPAGTLTGGASSGIDCGGSGTTCSVGYASGTNVTLTAQPLGSDTFVGWSGGGCSGTALTCPVTMSQSRSVTAAFTGVTSYTLDVSKSGSGTVSADVAPVSCGATCTGNYASGTPVTLTAAPSAGWVFDGWTGAGCSGTGTCVVTMSQAASVTATFSEQTFPLTVTAIGNGVVTAGDGTISCGNGDTFCSDVYGAGTLVTLTATPGSGQTLSGWSGACTGSAATCIVTLDQARSVTAAFTGTTSYPLDTAAIGSGTGTITSNVGGINCGVTCSATYASGTLVTLTATPSGASAFNGWSGDCSGTSTCVVTMSQARNVAADFGPQTRLLTVAKAGTGTGTVASDVGGISCGATCSANIADGTVVTLTPTASSGARFTGWSGDCSGTGACVVTMSQARTVTATFIAVYTLSVAKTGSGTVTGTGIACGATCNADYDDGTVVTLTAAAASGFRFTGWTSACSGTSTCVVTMSQARAVTANFVQVFTLSVAKTGSGTVTGSGIACGATCTADYDDGTLVTLTAAAASNSRFTGWSGACTGTGACLVTMSQARSVTATFVPVFSLTVTKSGSGSGAISSDVGNISCGAACAGDYDDGTVVTLTATPGGASSFDGWSGACSGAGACVVTMSQARSVTATFSSITRNLAVAKSGTGTGAVSSDAGGIDCGATCSAEYTPGDVVTLTAVPSGVSTFAGWSGDCSGTSTCVVTMTQARSVTAIFSLPLRTLTVNTSGSGAVTSDVPGIDCGATCSADYDDGTLVTLTAAASSGSRFTGWSGACSGTSTCVVTMSQARAVTAGFVQVFPLAVTKAGSGTGTVSSDLGPIDCGTTCSADYDDGTLVTLTAAATSGSRFTGWSGPCATGTCTVTMSQARTITATFVSVFTLSVAKTGSGTVTGGGIDCGATCAGDYDDGTVVTLTATAASGFRFAGWSGACSGTSTCVVTMSQARAVTAGFVAVFPLTVSKTGPGAVTGAGINCGTTCAGDYDDGTLVTLTATPASGSVFTGWSGDCSGTSTCVVTMSQARTVTAAFVGVYTLTVAKTGSGTVTGTGIACGATCSADYDDGTVVTLTAAAATGFRFTGWTGACSGTSTCVVTLSQARAVTANFVQVFTLTVAKTGSGTVTGSGIACGATCSADYDDGTLVTLTAAAASGSRFTGWTGACSGTSTCDVTMSQARAVTAGFVAVYTLTVSKTGPGAVTGGGIDCGTSCSNDYDDGTAVTLTAAAASGSAFTGWSGACSGTAACVVTMSQARTVTAAFAAGTVLAVTMAGSGAGTVDGAGISCDADCTADFDNGTLVTLTATAAPGSRFSGWTGACSGTGACMVTMSEAQAVTATFVRTFPLSVKVRGRGAVGSRPNGILCGRVCTDTYDIGTHVTLRATPRKGHWLVGWTGACNGRRATCTVTLSQARRVRARFATELTLRLRVPNRLVYHQPHERATIRAFATWHGKAIAGARIALLVTCPDSRTVTVLTSGKRGGVSFSFGSSMPNWERVHTCKVYGHVTANHRTARAPKAGTPRFIHPLWPDTRVENGEIVVRIWGRKGELVRLFTHAGLVRATRIGPNGWVDVRGGGIHLGEMLWVTGPHGHVSHHIFA
jgi:Divergent InlB B-repeat domain